MNYQSPIYKKFIFVFFNNPQNIDKNIRQKTKELKGFDKQISQTQIKILGLSKDITALSTELSKRKTYLKNFVKIANRYNITHNQNTV